MDGNRFYHQIGNAVCPPVVAAVCAQLLAAMGLPSQPTSAKPPGEEAGEGAGCACAPRPTMPAGLA